MYGCCWYRGAVSGAIAGSAIAAALTFEPNIPRMWEGRRVEPITAGNEAGCLHAVAAAPLYVQWIMLHKQAKVWLQPLRSMMARHSGVGWHEALRLSKRPTPKKLSYTQPRMLLRAQLQLLVYHMKQQGLICCQHRCITQLH